MKKLSVVLGFLTLSLFCLVNSEAKTSKPADEAICRVGCSASINGITYSTSAGSIFTSCETAGLNCARKLAALQ